MSTEETKKVAEVQSFEKEHVKVRVKDLKFCLTEMEIEVTVEGVQSLDKDALKAAKKEVSIPGFRKGKVPDHVVKNNFPKLIRENLRELVVHFFSARAFEAAELRPSQNGVVRVTKISEVLDNQPFKFTVTFEKPMQVPSVNPADVKLKSVHYPDVKPEDVEEELKKLQYDSGEWEDVTDHSIQEKDFVSIKVEKIQDDGSLAPIEGMKGYIEVSEQRIFKNLYQALLGKQVHDVFEIELETHDHHHHGPDEECSEQPVIQKFKVSVEGHKLCTPHELNDELAKKQRLETVDELRSNVEKYLVANREKAIKEDLSRELESFLFQHYDFEISDSILRNAVQNAAKNQNLTKEQTSNLIGTFLFHFRNKYILNKVFEENKLEITDEDFKAGLQKFIWDYYQARGEFPSDILDGSGHIEIVKDVVIEDKATDYLLKHATYD